MGLPAVNKLSDPEPTYSLVELARSWAEVTGDTPESILYRLADWAMTDAFPDDDRYQFTLHVEPKLKVLIVNGSPNPDPFENETLYLRAALSAERPAGKVDVPDPTHEIAQALDVPVGTGGPIAVSAPVMGSIV